MRDHETGQDKDFGYVTYGSLDEAQRAVMGMNETE
jgi:RNA recognition motif-containing protein